jgi:signal transduction histidine kinase/CheY-like chemotaxis protein
MRALIARDIVKGDCLVLQEDDTMQNVLAQIKGGEFSGVLIKTKAGVLSGIFTSSDLARCVHSQVPVDSPISHNMTRNPLTVGPYTPIAECARLMTEKRCRYLPMIDGNKILGIVTLYSVSAAMIESLEGRVVDLERLKSKLDMRDEYLGIVSHDIRSPLAVINICCEYLMAAETNGEKLTDYQKSFLERILNNSNRALGLVKGILDAMVIEHGGALNFSRVDITDFLEEIAANQRLLASRKNIKIHLATPARIFNLMDRKRVMQAIENLVGNAIKFTDKDRNIFISSEIVRRPSGDWLKISVRDEGGGIPEDKISKIFNKFHQLDTGVARDLGVGLGLSIVNQYIQSHQGEIVVEGGLGSGATFSALLPGASLERVNLGPRDLAPTILVVDDDTDIRDYFAADLTQEGFRVVQAKDGQDAVALLRREKPDVIISDILMPNLDGFELLTHVRNSHNQVPFILCSGVYPNLSDDVARSVFKADDMLEKPVETDALIAAIKRLLEARQIA